MKHLIPHKFQEKAAILIALKKGYGIFAEPGLGKTVIALRAIQIIKPKRVLVVAPLLAVCNTWPDEIDKWDMFQDLKYTFIHRSYPTDPNAQIFFTNPESLKPKLLRKIKFDMLIIDESTLFGNSKSLRFKRALKIAKRCKYRVIMTGCPIPRDYLNLFSQMKLIDLGETLYKKLGQYRTRYFERIPKRINASLTVDTWVLRKGMDKQIQRAIRPRCIALDAEGLIDMPELIERNIKVQMSPSQKALYEQFEQELFAEIDNGLLVSFSSGSKYVRCHQLANGACYDEDRNVLELHRLKIDALQNHINELDGAPLLVAYKYKHDASRIMKYIKGVTMYHEGCVDKWNAGKIPVLLAQYQTMSYSLNLQDGGRHVICYSLTDNYDHYYQMVRRIHRQGAKSKTFVHRIVTDGTVDLVCLKRLDRRQETGKDFIESLKAYRFMKMKRMFKGI